MINRYMTKIIIAVLIAAVVATGGYYAFKKGDGVVVTEETVSTTTPETSGKKMAFSEFVKQGGAYKCTVNQSVNNIDTVGTTYINKGMIRGEYNTKVQNLSVDTTLIVRDGYSYTWTSMLPNMGYKAKVADQKEVNTDAPKSATYSFNSEQIGDYDCKDWTVDETKFRIPAGVTFSEV
jgi:hypothetical protein